MNLLKTKWHELKEGYSKVTPVGIVLIVVCFVPDWHSRIAEWSSILKWIVQHLESGWGRFGTVVAMGLLIWWDHRRVLGHKKPMPHDTSAPIAAPVEEMSLQERLAEVSKGIFGYLRKCGEESPPTVGYIVRVHNGFSRDWYPKVEEVAYELGMVGYINFKFNTLIGDHHQAFSYDRIREIAEYLLKIKNEMELNHYRTATLTQKELDQMSAAELKSRADDPKFIDEVEMLGRFKRP